MANGPMDALPPALTLSAGGTTRLDLPPVGTTGNVWSVAAVEGKVAARIETRSPDPPPRGGPDAPPDTWSAIDTLVVEGDGNGAVILRLSRPFGNAPPRIHRIEVTTGP